MLKKYDKRKIKRFSLTEIIVSMAVFSVLLVMLLQFFTGAQKMWSSSAQKNSVYSNARCAMNMIASALQVMYYKDGQSPFQIVNQDSEKSILFLSKYPLSYKDGDGTLYYVKFMFKPVPTSAETADYLGKLVLHYMGPGDTSYKTYLSNTYSQYSTFLSNVNSAVNGTTAQEIISGVTGFSVVPVMPDYGNTSGTLTWNTSATGVPIAVEIRLSLMSPDDYREWYLLNNSRTEMASGEGGETAAAKKFRLAHEQSFNRLVSLGDYRYEKR